MENTKKEDIILQKLRGIWYNYIIKKEKQSNREMRLNNIHLSGYDYHKASLAVDEALKKDSDGNYLYSKYEQLEMIFQYEKTEDREANQDKSFLYNLTSYDDYDEVFMDMVSAVSYELDIEFKRKRKEKNKN
ncbi:hypothetical protein [Brachyspira catarrhinii]|uniref:Phage protein n=1 Tax=Brachyspira catarrhinii TaxID=2528966 RepID=A0ABY2TMW9_9SPIR|nr:hypothetical protein [Brachyspira catarrhinii]TKZ26812.1 hypothetical protein EZH24_12145 [Brachyspira catarrhinii]